MTPEAVGMKEIELPNERKKHIFFQIKLNSKSLDLPKLRAAAREILFDEDGKLKFIVLGDNFYVCSGENFHTDSLEALREIDRGKVECSGFFLLFLSGDIEINGFSGTFHDQGFLRKGQSDEFKIKVLKPMFEPHIKVR